MLPFITSSSHNMNSYHDFQWGINPIRAGSISESSQLWLTHFLPSFEIKSALGSVNPGELLICSNQIVPLKSKTDPQWQQRERLPPNPSVFLLHHFTRLHLQTSTRSPWSHSKQAANVCTVQQLTMKSVNHVKLREEQSIWSINTLGRV